MTLYITAFGKLRHDDASTDFFRKTGEFPDGFDSRDWYSKAFYLYRDRYQRIDNSQLGGMLPGVYRTTPQTEMLKIEFITIRFAAFQSVLWDFAYEQLSWLQKFNPLFRLPFRELVKFQGDGKLGTSIAQKLYNDFVFYETLLQDFDFVSEKEKEQFLQLYHNLKHLTKIAAQEGFLVLE
jgi:hypothetical protein